MSITTKKDGDVEITTISGADLKALQQALKSHVPPGHCVNCGKPFTAENVKTPAGWRETELSQMCEVCWDAMAAAIEQQDAGEAESARVDQVVRDVDRILGAAGEEQGFDDDDEP